MKLDISIPKEKSNLFSFLSCSIQKRRCKCRYQDTVWKHIHDKICINISHCDLYNDESLWMLKLPIIVPMVAVLTNQKVTYLYLTQNEFEKNAAILKTPAILGFKRLLDWIWLIIQRKYPCWVSCLCHHLNGTSSHLFDYKCRYYAVGKHYQQTNYNAHQLHISFCVTSHCAESIITRKRP